jgi:hypothetical protein
MPVLPILMVENIYAKIKKLLVSEKVDALKGHLRALDGPNV